MFCTLSGMAAFLSLWLQLKSQTFFGSYLQAWVACVSLKPEDKIDRSKPYRLRGGKEDSPKENSIAIIRKMGVSIRQKKKKPTMKTDIHSITPTLSAISASLSYLSIHQSAQHSRRQKLPAEWASHT